MRNLKPFLFVIVAAASAGCMDQNPFPQEGTVSVNPTPHHEVVLPWVLDAPASVKMKEGEKSTFTVLAKVDAGTRVLTAKNLPAGATFDPTTGIFSWTPDENAGHDQTDPGVFEKVYPVQFFMSSTANPLASLTREVQITVQGVAKPLQIHTDGSRFTVNEGESIQVQFHVQSPDFPKGPFSLRFDNLPDGATIASSIQDPTLFTLSFSPGFDFVSSSDDTWDGSSYVRTVQLAATATGPRAQTVKQAFSLDVRDVRKAPAVSAPDQLVFSYAAEFAISAEDMNGEVPPIVSVDQPGFGKVEIRNKSSLLKNADRTRSRSNPVQVSVIDWTGIPPEQMNKPQQLTLHACANGTPDHQRGYSCTQKIITMKFVGQLHHAPVIDRSDWALGEVKYLRQGSKATFYVAANDPDGTTIPSVEIQPESMRAEVSYSHGQLKVQALSTGTKVFQLVATSSFGIRTVESFTLRALPKGWGSMILLGESRKDAEVQATLGLVADAQVLNPAIDSVDEDALRLRASLFVTTSAINSGISLPDLGALLTGASGALNRVILSTPLVTKLPRPSLPDDLVIVGRFNDLNSLPQKPTLNSMTVVPAVGSEFTASQGPVKLNQTLTSESPNPLILGTVPNGSCRVALSLMKDQISLPIAVVCEGQDGKKTLIAGIEWGDLAFGPADSDLGKKWLHDWLGGDNK